MDREMGLSEKDKFALEERDGDHLNHHTSIAISQGNQMGSALCPSLSMVDSFPSLWSHSTNLQDLGFCENKLQTSINTSNNVPVGKPVPLSSRLDMEWNSVESISKGGMFLQTAHRIVHPSLSQFPPTFVDPAARFSCFNGGRFSHMVNPFNTYESLNPYSNASKGIVGAQIPKSEVNMPQDFKDVSMSLDHGSNSGSSRMNQGDKGSLQSNAYREPGFNGGDPRETPNSSNGSGDSSFKGLAAKKKRTHQDMELDQVQGCPQLSPETANENVGTKHKLEQNSTRATVKLNGKQAKDSSDAAKEDYIHIRARRGQATNSHSLAERVRRERISERMKYLQELVPGCSKVTGKAVMLDEIINYVQSLQRQVEFLSMKLAAVNPRLDFNIEGILSKDSRGGPSTIGFSPEMMHPQLHPSQQGLVQAGISDLVNHSDALRRAVHAQLTAMNGYKEPMPQAPDAWDNQLQNVFQMTFGANPPIDTQELNGKPRDGFPL